MKNHYLLTILLFSIVLNLFGQEKKFLADINGDHKDDFITISEEGDELLIRQNYIGNDDFVFTFLSEIKFNPSNNFDYFTVADVTGDNRANLILIKNTPTGKDLWYFEILPEHFPYKGHTFIPISGSDEANQIFADINNDNKDELILIKNSGSDKELWTYNYINGDFIYQDSSYTKFIDAYLKKEYFADITGDNKEDLILVQDYNNDQRVWVYKSNGVTLDYLAYTNLADQKGKEVFFMNSNTIKDNFSDLILASNTPEGKRLWLYESDGARFNYEITNTLESHNDKLLLFGDLNKSGTDDLIVNEGTNIWAYNNYGNVFTYKEHSYLNFKSIPPNRENQEFSISEWKNSGYQSNNISIPGNTCSNCIVNLANPVSDSNQNDENLKNALIEAANLKIQYPNYHIIVQLQKGIYHFSDTLKLGDDIKVRENQYNLSKIIIKGKGTLVDNNPTYTEIVFDINVDSSGIPNNNNYIQITNGSEIGVENLSIRYNPSNTVQCNAALKGYRLVEFRESDNCWIKNIELSGVYNVGISLACSNNIEIRDSFFHDALCSGGGGQGYGIAVSGKECTDNLGGKYNKIENNIFKKFRHSMLLNHNAKYNVFGYNYSREQYGKSRLDGGDLILHGSNPNSNLFEGNYVEYIVSDYQGGENKNGKNNTLFRNYVYKEPQKLGNIYLDHTEKTNVVGNEYNVIIYGQNDTISKPSVFELYDFNYDLYIKDGDILKTYNFLGEWSLYLNEKPSFFNNYNNVSWPAIGPMTIDQITINQNIPAKLRWENYYSSKKKKITQNNSSDILPKKNDFIVSPNPSNNGVFYLEINNSQKIIQATLEVRSLLGELLNNYKYKIDKSKPNFIKIDLSDKENGIYILKIKSGNSSYYKKIVKK
ncbi:T9SS type A sorting domain-containing protein [Aquimarina latercula]|uniref:T9SS type A sorting domain-containing protein n=1 Tax=Aquimarina latercula TaxID=987 RepID=UPI0004135585|nr:T9SS type A sorting domain-containing protein [Aquimarina latercula]